MRSSHCKLLPVDVPLVVALDRVRMLHNPCRQSFQHVWVRFAMADETFSSPHQSHQRFGVREESVVDDFLLQAQCQLLDKRNEPSRKQGLKPRGLMFQRQHDSHVSVDGDQVFGTSLAGKFDAIRATRSPVACGGTRQ